MNVVTNIHPAMLFTSLKGNAKHPKKIRNLELLQAICVERENAGLHDFSMRTVGLELEKRGGPKLKTLWNNKPSEDYQKLIKAWDSFAGSPSHRIAEKVVKENEFLKSLSDPAVRILVAELQNSVRRLQNELNVLKSRTELTIDARPRKASTQTNTVGDVTVEVTKGPDLNTIEREALEHAISTELWESEGWKEERNGRIVRDLGQGRTRSVFRPGYVSAIRKILK